MGRSDYGFGLVSVQPRAHRHSGIERKHSSGGRAAHSARGVFLHSHRQREILSGCQSIPRRAARLDSVAGYHSARLTAPHIELQHRQPGRKRQPRLALPWARRTGPTQAQSGGSAAEDLRPTAESSPTSWASTAGSRQRIARQGNPNGYFCGTSQAAPHVTGLAALVKQRFPSYSPSQVANYLKTGAEARGAVPNNTWGYGFARLPKSADLCVTPIDGDATHQRRLDERLRIREQRRRQKPTTPASTPSRWDEPADVTITLTSNIDTYIYLLSGAGKDGAVAHKTDETVRTNSSRIEASLAAGDYTIEATTYDPSVTGDFTLTVEGLGQGTVTPPTPAPSPTPEPTPEPTPSPTPEPTPSPSVGYTYLAVGELHTCGLRTDGLVVCWATTSTVRHRRRRRQIHLHRRRRISYLRHSRGRRGGLLGQKRLWPINAAIAIPLSKLRLTPTRIKSFASPVSPMLICQC